MANNDNQYQLASPSWTSFIPSPRAKSAKTITHYSKEIHLTTPPLASPAILNLLTIVQQASTVQLRTDKISKVCDNSEAEWNRCVILGEGSFGRTLTPAFTPKRCLSNSNSFLYVPDNARSTASKVPGKESSLSVQASILLRRHF